MSPSTACVAVRKRRAPRGELNRTGGSLEQGEQGCPVEVANEGELEVMAPAVVDRHLAVEVAGLPGRRVSADLRHGEGREEIAGREILLRRQEAVAHVLRL